MFKNTFQSGFLSILYSIGSKPLQIWERKVRDFFFSDTVFALASPQGLASLCATYLARNCLVGCREREREL